MGLFFEHPQPAPELVDLMRQAVAQPPSDDAHDEAVALAGNLHTLVGPLQTALQQQPPTDPADITATATAKATAVTNQLLGGATFNTGRFVVAIAIFFALLAAAVWTDADNLKNAPTALFGLATTIFGVVVGFLGSEKT